AARAVRSDLRYRELLVAHLRGTSMSADTVECPRWAGLHGVIYYIPEADLPRARDSYARLFGVAPVDDRAYFVSFVIGGFELGLHVADEKAQPSTGGQTAYWRVPDLGAAIEWFLACGATSYRRILETSEGGFVTQFKDPF